MPRVIDYSIYRAGQLGLRLNIPLTNYRNYYLGSIYNFTTWPGQPPCTSSTYACPAQARARANASAPLPLRPLGSAQGRGPGGGSLRSSQNMPTARIASANSVNATGLRT